MRLQLRRLMDMVATDAFNRLQRLGCRTAGHERKELQALLGRALNISKGPMHNTNSFKDLKLVWDLPDQTFRAETVYNTWAIERPWIGSQRL